MVKKLQRGFIGYERKIGYSKNRGEYNCYKCQRLILNLKWFTDNGCIWCDFKYWRKKNG